MKRCWCRPTPFCRPADKNTLKRGTISERLSLTAGIVRRHESRGRRKVKAESAGHQPCLAVILVGRTLPARSTFAARSTTVRSAASRPQHQPAAGTTRDALLAEVKKLDDAAVTAFWCAAAAAQIDGEGCHRRHPARKDVDGFSPVNVNRLMQIGEPCYLPCTPAGCIRMIESTGTDGTGRTPSSLSLRTSWASPRRCCCWRRMPRSRSATQDEKSLKEVCAARGIFSWPPWARAFSDNDMVKPGAVVIDVGINRGAGRQAAW